MPKDSHPNLQPGVKGRSDLGKVNSFGTATPTTNRSPEGEPEKEAMKIRDDPLTPVDPQPMSDSKNNALDPNKGPVSPKNNSAAAGNVGRGASRNLVQKRIQNILRTLSSTVPLFNSATQALQLATAMNKVLVQLPLELYTRFKQWAKENPKKCIFILVCVIAGMAAGPLLAAVGFTAGGVAAGSFAAVIQSMFGNVAAGSLFATLQGLGATGLVGTLGVGFAVSLPARVAVYYGLQKDGWLRDVWGWVRSRSRRSEDQRRLCAPSN